ncbi:flagellar biosynthesis protein FlhF [Curvibacter sp. CHRR-16]|uniref:flagellar biosynthesis protein FlhF n=1 Tax=Curvibacter sp. CHRR-16 TaxID=2835872 RepID=UPI001BD9E86E|nr:flagellar biosynthesis protein FlhF [Curvibacter sp. CHRR-16]MBT0569539.1 flagellar biosynthesis protein FlhF [Curvibacter sp. CHRR-16]
MTIQRFIAPTSREALAKARMAFGEGTLILSNRQTEHGVEVVATAEDTLDGLDASLRQSHAPASSNGGKTRPAPGSYQETAQQVEADVEKLSMSTLSFQDYVRERMARRKQEQEVASVASDTPSLPNTVAPRAPQRQAPANARNTASHEVHTPQRAARAPAPIQVAPNMPDGVMQELQSMRELIEDRFNTLTWLGQARKNPIHSNLMLKLIRAGYSPSLARAVLERLPEEMDAPESLRWVMDVLERNIRTDATAQNLHEEGGVFALVGSTGVGKTTTAAKLAGLCAQTYGPSSVGLITLDTYRVGAHEQLRTYGKMLGVVAHMAHDKAALQDLLGLLSNKKMVLIDTTGIAPRDPRKQELLDLIDLPRIKRILVLNAGSHGDTLDEAVQCFKTGAIQHAVLSKIDEAVKLGPAIDAVIRHQLLLRGVTTGQRVPEDWESASAAKLVQLSMRSSGNSAHDPKDMDLGFFFSHANNQNLQGVLHA